MSVTYARLWDGVNQFSLKSGALNVAGRVIVRYEGTDDLADLYDENHTRLSNPVVLDNDGRAMGVFVDAARLYWIDVQDRYGSSQFTVRKMTPVGSSGLGNAYDVISSDGSIYVDKYEDNGTTTFDLSVAEDDVNRLDWIRCEGSRLLACSDIYLPVYADGPMEVGSVGVRLGAGKYYHVTAHVRATKSAVSPWYDRVFVVLSQKFPTGPDTVITNQSFVVDGSMELVQDFEVSCDTMVESDCELKIEIVGDLNNVTYAVTDLEIHRVYSGVAQGTQLEQVQSDWTETDIDNPSYIKHKPNLATVATTGDYNDLSNKPFIPADKVYIFWDMGFNRAEIRAAIEEHKVIMDWDRTSNEHRFFTKYEEKVIDGNLCELYHFAHIETDYETPFATTWRLGDMCYIYDTVRQIQYAEHDTKLFDHEVPSPTSADAGKVLTAAWDSAQAAGSWSWQTASTPTVDQTYNSASTNAQSGTAVAGALATINQVPASTSADEDKVLTVDSNGDPVWAVSQSGESTYTAGDGIEIDANNEISAKVDGTTITVNASGELEAIGGTGSQVQANWAETDQSDPSFIQNKPTIPAAQVNADWTASSGVAEILHKPTIPSATSDLTNDSGFITTSDVPAAQEQADWNESDTTDPAYIKNKPTIPAAQVNSDWTASSGVAQILNKPTIPSATSDLTNDSGYITSSDVPGAQAQSDWTESDTTDPSYIQNKPTTKTISAGSGISITESSNNVVISATGGGGTQVQANWTETDPADPSYIQNKPTIPAAQVNADWTASSGVAEILHKPSIPSATSDLTNDSGYITSSDVPSAQAQADWNESNSSDPSYIKNKPTIPSAVTVDQTYNSSSTNPQSGTAVAGAIAGVNQVPASTSLDEDKVLTVNSSGNPVWAPAQGSAQVQSDWTESDTADPSYIQNKPTEKSLVAGSNISITADASNVTISATVPAQVNADWTSSSGVSEILNKPDLVDIVAGPGIVVDNPDGNTLRVSMAADYETVLWSGSSTGQTPTFALSESYRNFEYLRITAVEEYGFVGSVTLRTENITTDNRFSVPIYVVNSGFTRGVGIRSIYFHPTSNTAFDSQCGGFDFVNGYAVNDKTHVKTIVGIHRIAGGN